jgi:hypothetical protein
MTESVRVVQHAAPAADTVRSTVSGVTSLAPSGVKRSRMVSFARAHVCLLADAAAAAAV